MLRTFCWVVSFHDLRSFQQRLTLVTNLWATLSQRGRMSANMIKQNFNVFCEHFCLSHSDRFLSAIVSVSQWHLQITWSHAASPRHQATSFALIVLNERPWVVRYCAFKVRKCFTFNHIKECQTSLYILAEIMTWWFLHKVSESCPNFTEISDMKSMGASYEIQSIIQTKLFNAI